MAMSIRGLLFGAFVVAIDGALFLPLMSGGTLRVVLGMMGALPMVNILLIVCYRNLCRGTVKRPFFLGFAALGAIAVVVWFHGCLSADEDWLQSFNRWFARTLEGAPYVEEIGATIDNDSMVLKGIYYSFVNLTFLWSFTFLPQLVIAIAGGWLAVGLAAALGWRRASARPVP